MSILSHAIPWDNMGWDGMGWDGTERKIYKIIPSHAEPCSVHVIVLIIFHDENYLVLDNKK